MKKPTRSTVIAGSVIIISLLAGVVLAVSDPDPQRKSVELIGSGIMTASLLLLLFFISKRFSQGTWRKVFLTLLTLLTLLGLLGLLVFSSLVFRSVTNPDLQSIISVVRSSLSGVVIGLLFYSWRKFSGSATPLKSATKVK